MSDKCNWTSIPGISFGSAIDTLQTNMAYTIASTFSSFCSSGNHDSYSPAEGSTEELPN
jgi:hypothetical protein